MNKEIEHITAFKFTYEPFDVNFPIAYVEVTIIAKNRKEAELIALSNNYKFFDQDCRVKVSEGMHGYREVKK